MSTFDLSWLSNPQVFSVGELAPFSDHQIYASIFEADSDRSSRVRSLDGTWKAHYAITPSEVPDELICDASMDDALNEINIPCEFQLANPSWDAPHYVNTQYPWDGQETLVPPQVSTTYNPTVTAIKHFILTEAEIDSKQVVLTFEAVEAALALYVNGSFIGYAEDSFVPHHFDITSFVHAGDNRIVARVFKRCTGSWMEDQDFWRFSGIHRSVTLSFWPKTHLHDLFVRTPLEDNYSRAFIEADLSIDHPEGEVTLVLVDHDKNIKLYETLHQEAHISIRREIQNVKLWSAETPHLYKLLIILSDANDTVLEVSKQAVGFRQFEMINKIMCLNGKRIVFHGVNRHEFDCDRGRVMTDEILLKDIHDMKGMNINAVRTCHYPNDSRFYRLCDQYGLYVIDETNIESHGSWAPMHDWYIPGDKPEWRAMTLRRGQSMQERDKNHPCVLLWSCGNESYGGTNLRDLAAMFRDRDHTRLVHYEGVANDPRYPETTDVYSRMYFKVAEIEQYLNSNPDKPFINCEYTHAMGNSCGGMSLYSALEDKYPMYQGGFIWDYVDQALRTTAPNGAMRLAYGGDYGDRPSDWQFNTNGIILGDRTFTGKVQEVRYLYQNIKLVPDRAGVTVINKQLFASVKNLKLRWQLVVDTEMVDHGSMVCPEVLPESQAYISLPVTTEWDDSQEAVLTCFLDVDSDDELLERGFSVAHGQMIWKRSTNKQTPVCTDIEVVTGDYNIGFYSSRLSAMIGYREGGLISLMDGNQKQTLLRAPMLSMFRAWIDNDHGNKYDIEQGFWHVMSRYSYVSEPKIEKEVGATIVTFTYTNSIMKSVQAHVSYIFRNPDSIDVELCWPGAAGLPDMAALGMSFQLDPRLKHIRYFGMGPDENYIDRCEGAYLDWFTYDVHEGMTRYEKPQESGNRMGVERMMLTDDEGHGILITGQDLQISVQPYLPEELACVYHYDELQGSCRTVLDVAAFRKGIGGDDSWAAPVLPQFTYPADRPYVLRFSISTI